MAGFVMTFHKCTCILVNLIITLPSPPLLFFLLPSCTPLFSCLVLAVSLLLLPSLDTHTV